MRTAVGIAAAIVCPILLGTSNASIALDIKEFALSMGYQPLNPPQRVESETSNLWKPGTVIYYDKVKRTVITLPVCELLFNQAPNAANVTFGAVGAADLKQQNGFGVALSLLGDLIGKVTGTVNAKFDYSKHLKVSYSGLGAIVSTSQDMYDAALASRANGALSTDCAKVLASPDFNSSNDPKRIRFRVPVYVIAATGIARGMKIELTSSAKTEVGADLKLPEVVEVKPTWGSTRSAAESLEIDGLTRPIIWGYRPMEIKSLLRTGAVAATGTDEFEFEFGGNSDLAEANHASEASPVQ